VLLPQLPEALVRGYSQASSGAASAAAAGEGMLSVLSHVVQMAAGGVGPGSASRAVALSNVTLVLSSCR
jgi:hypothetical protein